jgi:hypothetical protein
METFNYKTFYYDITQYKIFLVYQLSKYQYLTILYIIN